jgi:ankyrin repeat protein
MPSLPERANLEWLRKTAKDRLKTLRATQPAARLADAYLAVAREHGFTSWRALKARVDGLAAARVPVATVAAPPVAETAARDVTLKRILHLVATEPIEALRALLAAEPAIVNISGPHPFWGGRPQPLHVAIETGRAEVFELLLASGADVNGSNEPYAGWSPLMLAAYPGREPMRDALLGRGARVGVVEALMLADDARLDALLTAGGAGALPTPPPNDGSILMFARTLFAVDRLLALGVAAHTADPWGSTPIDAFSRLGDRGQPLVARLVALGVAAPPHVYARLGDRPRLEQVLARDPASVRADDVLLAAVDGRHHDLVAWLLAHGASSNARAGAQSRQTALHAAAWNGDLPMARLLVEAGADVGARDAEHDATPQGWAETSVEVTRNPAGAEVARYLATRAG